MTTINRETVSDALIVDLNGMRDKPCMDELDGCYVVSKARIFDDGEVFRVERVRDINVFATEGEAEEYVARMYRACSDSVIKYAYTVRYHHVKL